jgi:hypothetical protein
MGEITHLGQMARQLFGDCSDSSGNFVGIQLHHSDA